MEKICVRKKISDGEIVSDGEKVVEDSEEDNEELKEDDETGGET